MNLWAVIPVKPLKRLRSDHNNTLTDDEWSKLNTTMLESIIQAIRNVQGVEEILVVSKDTFLLSIARDRNVKTLHEGSGSDINTALKRAATVASMYKSHSLLVLAADLPLITTDDVESFINISSMQPEMVIAPDRRNIGTNAILLNPLSTNYRFQFGGNSFDKHLSEAQRLQYHIAISDLKSLRIDIDSPEDFEWIKEQYLKSI
ncbi:MAG: 2-phospho-L-lactate guanylyltransferase [Anaerolineaceae bacterium]|nr:2-phospho-L-lactate guanylyltransferase [Anaerolineaceae bacterium]